MIILLLIILILIVLGRIPRLGEKAGGFTVSASGVSIWFIVASFIYTYVLSFVSEGPYWGGPKKSYDQMHRYLGTDRWGGSQAAWFSYKCFEVCILEPQLNHHFMHPPLASGRKRRSPVYIYIYMYIYI